MKNIEDYKNDIASVLKDMAKIEAFLDTVTEHNGGDELFKVFFRNIIKNDMPELIKEIDSLTETIKTDVSMVSVEPEKMSDVDDVYASIEFIEHRMKIIKTKHALCYFNYK